MMTEKCEELLCVGHHIYYSSALSLISIYLMSRIFSELICVFFPANISETITDEVVQKLYGPDVVVAEIIHPDGRPGVQMRMSDVPVTEKLEKFVEDVK